ncbi:hypothetical protein ABMA28_001872 [Loxostege sticticalis]|uniref:Polyprotein n=1 Tax=Loxostege sticticalis TaxID=481309 RepID=A0ABD0SZ88_LOXSC
MRTLKGLLTIIENDSKKVWRDELDEVQLALNSTRSRVTGFTPTELMFGTRAQSLGLSQISPNLETPSRSDLESIRNRASENIIRSADSQIEKFNRGKARVKRFTQGDFVFIKCSERNQTKLARKFKGPFVIVKVLENDRYELKGMNRSNRIFKYAHENLRLVPKGFEGLVDVATTLINDEEAETAVGENLIDQDPADSDSDTISVSREATLSAGSDTLTASSEIETEMIEHKVQVHAGK